LLSSFGSIEEFLDVGPFHLVIQDIKVSVLAKLTGDPLCLLDRHHGLVRLHTPWAPGLIGHAYQYDIASNLQPESLSGPNAGLTEVLIPAGYVTTVYDPVYRLTSDGKRYVSRASIEPTTIPAPGLPFSLVFRAEPGREDVLLRIASADEAASQRRVLLPDFPPL
jgi:amidase